MNIYISNPFKKKEPLQESRKPPVTSNGTETDARTCYSSYLGGGSNGEKSNDLPESPDLP